MIAWSEPQVQDLDARREYDLRDEVVGGRPWTWAVV